MWNEQRGAPRLVRRLQLGRIVTRYRFGPRLANEPAHGTRRLERDPTMAALRPRPWHQTPAAYSADRVSLTTIMGKPDGKGWRRRKLAAALLPLNSPANTMAVQAKHPSSSHDAQLRGDEASNRPARRPPTPGPLQPGKGGQIKEKSTSCLAVWATPRIGGRGRARHGRPRGGGGGSLCRHWVRATPSSAPLSGRGPGRRGVELLSNARRTSPLLLVLGVKASMEGERETRAGRGLLLSLSPLSACPQG